MREITKRWGIEGSTVQIYHSAWSVGEDYVLKEYFNQTTMQRNIQMIRILGEEGVPVPKVVQLENGNDFYESDDKFYLMTSKLKGKNVVEERHLDEEWFWKFGVILANLHLAFRECEKTMSFWNNSLLEEMEGWVTRELEGMGPEFLPKEKIEETIKQLEEVYADLPKQLIHRDVHLGNFLFDDQQFSGYIDFDLSQCNIRIFDICYFLLGLLLREKNQKTEEFWFVAIEKVVEGYQSILPLSQVEISSIACVMKNIELLFVAYFWAQKDEKQAHDAAKIFLYVCENEDKILH